MDNILNGCLCESSDAAVRIVPLSCAFCLYECKGCNAAELVGLNDKEHLLPLVEEIKKFDYEPGWSNGKYLVCFGKQEESGNCFKTCYNENPEAFRYVMRTPRKYHHCINCEACVPVNDDDLLCEELSFAENPACPICNRDMETVEENGEHEEPCRVCWSCDGVLPLSKVRAFERAREREAQKGKACSLCSGALKTGRGLFYFKCEICESTMGLRPLRNLSNSAIKVDPIKCVNCFQIKAHAVKEEDLLFSECVQCGAVGKEQSTVQNGADCCEAGTAVGDKVVCESCTSEEFEYRLDESSVLVTCAVCEKLVRSFNFDQDASTKDSKAVSILEKTEDHNTAYAVTVANRDQARIAARDDVLNALVNCALKELVFRIDGPPCLTAAIVAWAQAAWLTVRRVAAGQLCLSAGLELIVFDFLKYAVVSLGNMGAIEVERNMAAFLLRRNVPLPLVDEAVRVAGLATRNVRDTIFEKLEEQLRQIQ